MGRWKDNGSGQAYWDANDSGPDQIAPPTQATTSVPTSGQPGTLPTGPRFPSAGSVTAPIQTNDTFDPSKKIDNTGVAGGVDRGRPLKILPDGQGGWSHDGGSSAKPAAGTIEQILEMLKGRFGGAGGVMGPLNAGAPSTSQQNPLASVAPSVPLGAVGTQPAKRGLFGAIGHFLGR